MTYIGIDPGTHTGIAVWDGRQIIECTTLPIHRALKLVRQYQEHLPDGELFVVIEDARQRKYFTGNVSAKAQGAGSIKRDCSIWEDFCKDLCIPFHAVPPQKGMTKVSPEYLKMIAHWDKRTSNHARDAAMLVIGR